MSRSKVKDLVCPAQMQDGACLCLEMCYARKDSDPCPYECDGCSDVTPDLNDEGLCPECRHDPGGEEDG